MTKETEAKWVERVREWRASGLSAEEFATSKGYKASTLSWAASLLREAAASPPAPSTGQAPSRPRGKRRRRSRSEMPRFLPVRTRPTGAVAEMVVEVGAARIRVARGFDVSLLGEVVRALGGASR
jgi:hypothetical protein